VWNTIKSAHWENELKTLVQRHADVTQSELAKSLISNWEIELPNFKQVTPKEILSRLEHPLDDSAEAAE
jgi:glutamate synthase (NADPH/NADH) large chain